MSWRKFVGNQQSIVLPYLGGPTVFAEGRRLRVSSEVPSGFWRFDVSGRVATPVEPAEPPDLSALPRERGHFAAGWLFVSGTRQERIELLPAEEPAVLSPLSARRWHSEDLIFENLELESEAEDAARRALEAREPLTGIKGVAASLRAAFGFALADVVGREIGVPVSPREVRSHALELAERGRDAVVERLRQLEQRRRLESIRVGGPPARQLGRPLSRARSANERIHQALEASGAAYRASRDLGNGTIEVTFNFLGERFISIVDADTLQVYDSGICLSGADRLVNLDSLPSVIREAIETEQLVITRR